MRRPPMMSFGDASVELPPGRSTLSLVSPEPALRPSETSQGSTDTRLLSFALARLKITAL